MKRNSVFKPVSIRLLDNYIQKIDDIASASNSSRSNVIELILRRWVDSNELFEMEREDERRNYELLILEKKRELLEM